MNDSVRRVAVLKVVHEHVTTLYDGARAEAAAHLEEGSRLPIRTPGGEKIATVSKTEPVRTARIEDTAAFEAWARVTYPDRVKTEYGINGTDNEVKKILFAHAPHLLREYRVVDPELVKEVRRLSVKLGVPAGPDGEVDVPGVVVERPSGTVVCRPDENGLAEVIEMFRSGLLTFDGLAQIDPPDGAA